MEKRLFRNEHEKVIAGVSSGIAEYIEVDVTIVRLLFVLSTIFLVGTGILVYAIMWIVVPVNNDPAAKFSRFNEFFKGPHGGVYNSPNAFTQQHQQAYPQPEPKKAETQDPNKGWTSSTINNDPFAFDTKKDFKPYQKRNSETGRTVGGLFLLVIGIFFLMKEFNIIPFWLGIDKLWPLIFVAIGVSFIMKSKRKNAWEEWKSQQEEQAAASVDPIVTDVPVSPVQETPVSTVQETPTGAAHDIPASTVQETPSEETGTVNPETGSSIDDRFKKKED